jgi:hypothetical protein
MFASKRNFNNTRIAIIVFLSFGVLWVSLP